MSPWSVLYVALAACVCTAESAKILGVFHVTAYSHYQLGSTLLTELARQGHDVTVINAHPQKQPVKNFRDVELKGFLQAFQEKQKYFYMQVDANFFVLEMAIQLYLFFDTLNVLKDENVQSLLQSDETFDLVILEEMGSHALKGFCYHYGAPCISFSSTGATRWINSQVGNPSPISYIPDVVLPYLGNMTFLQRVHNTLIYMFFACVEHLLIFPLQNVLLQSYFPGAPHVRELHQNVSLAFVNAHVSTHQPVPYVPNMIDIGGFHVKPPKPLPTDLHQYLDNAKKGVIFFSLGSNTRSIDMDVEKLDMILKTFGRLKQKVLWKWEKDHLPGKPSNVRIGKWLPQNDILAHPNIKLFITHGGLLSTTEAIHHGVPIVGMPLFADQKINLANAINHGLGQGVTYSDLTEADFFSAIQEVTSNSKYQENAKRLSNILHDQPIKPLDKAVFWVEYVLRHRGAPHLRTAALSLSWYQYLLLDVLLFIFCATFIPIAALYYFIRKCRSRGKLSNKITEKKKKKS